MNAYDLGGLRVVDLTKGLDPATETRRCHLYRFNTGGPIPDYHTIMDLTSHLGTHCECPYHHDDAWPDVASLPLTSFMGRGLYVTITGAERNSYVTPEVLDRFAMSAAFAAAFVRLGNFMNSEIVGRITDGFFKVKFPRYDRRALRPCLEECGKVAKDVCDYVGDQCYNLANVPWRYPSQLFEFVMGLLVLLMLWLADRLAGKEKRPIGMLGSLFFVLYFTARFTVEFFKEYQTLSPDESILTMGQYLSLPFICLGGIGLWIAMSHKTPTCIYRPAGAAPLTAEGVPVEEKSAAEAPAKAEAGEKAAAETDADAKETEAGAAEAAKDAKETETGASESEAGASEAGAGVEENEKGEA